MIFELGSWASSGWFWQFVWVEVPLGEGRATVGRSGCAASGGERFVVWRLLKAVVEILVCRVIRLIVRPKWLEVHSPPRRGYCTMSELRERMIRDLRHAGMAEKDGEGVCSGGSAVGGLLHDPAGPTERTAGRRVIFSMFGMNWRLPEERLRRCLPECKFFYVNTLGYDWPLLTKKNPPAPAEAFARRSE